MVNRTRHSVNPASGADGAASSQTPNPTPAAADPRRPAPPAAPADVARRQARDADIATFAGRHLSGENQELLEGMLLTLTRLARDGADRGDVKLITKAFAELRYALKVFAPYRETRKVSIFGSARTPEDHPDYRQAETFARLMCDRGWMVITGAGDGIMKAGHGGAGPEASFGVAIRLPFEQKTNTIIKDDAKLVNFRYFFTRKLMFVKEASAVVLFPGGFGTHDEGYEALTLVQTGKAPLFPIVMLEQPGGTYWRNWRDYVVNELLGKGMVSPEDLSLFLVTDNVEAAVREVTGFYRVYHSMRFVDDDLVLRLQYPLSPATLDRLNANFARILTAGRIEQTGPVPGESGELTTLPRLRMRFDRKSCGLLRECINVINQEPPPAGAEKA